MLLRGEQFADGGRERKGRDLSTHFHSRTVGEEGRFQDLVAVPTLSRYAIQLNARKLPFTKRERERESESDERLFVQVSSDIRPIMQPNDERGGREGLREGMISADPGRFRGVVMGHE